MCLQNKLKRLEWDVEIDDPCNFHVKVSADYDAIVLEDWHELITDDEDYSEGEKDVELVETRTADNY